METQTNHYHAAGPIRPVSLILDRLSPHLDRAGAPALLMLALRLALAGGGPCPLSYTDLARLIGCSSSTVLKAVRLNETLQILRCTPGQPTGRRGPAPLVWELAWSTLETGAIDSTSSTIQSPNIALQCEAGPAAPPDQGTRITADREATACCAPLFSASHRELACRDQIHQPSDPTDGIRSGSATQTPAVSSPADAAPDDRLPLIDQLITMAAQQTGERSRQRMAQAIGPQLAELAAAGWSEQALRTLLDESLAATAAYRPVHPASYLATVLHQRLSGVGTCDTRRRAQDVRPNALSGSVSSAAPTARIQRPQVTSRSVMPALVRPLPEHQPGALAAPSPESVTWTDPAMAPALAVWQAPASVPGLPCSPAAALRAACTVAGLTGEAYLRGAVLGGWTPDGQLLVATPAPIPAAITARLQPALGRGLSELLARRVACRLVPAAELGGLAAEGPDTAQVTAVPRPVSRLTG